MARELLGKNLVLSRRGRCATLMIHEVEAYDGFEDRASHAFRGKTPRTSVMFGPAGHWYVYLVYGMYWMLNIVTGPQNYPAAVLIRGAGEISGPGKLTKHLGISRYFNGKPATPACGLWIEEIKAQESFSIKKTPRIGVAYAGNEWAGKPYRFLIDGCKAL